MSRNHPIAETSRCPSCGVQQFLRRSSGFGPQQTNQPQLKPHEPFPSLSPRIPGSSCWHALGTVLVGAAPPPNPPPTPHPTSPSPLPPPFPPPPPTPPPTPLCSHAPRRFKKERKTSTKPTSRGRGHLVRPGTTWHRHRPGAGHVRGSAEPGKKGRTPNTPNAERRAWRAWRNEPHVFFVSPFLFLPRLKRVCFLLFVFLLFFVSAKPWVCLFHGFGFVIFLLVPSRESGNEPRVWSPQTPPVG